jgi:hypothetical protein
MHRHIFDENGESTDYSSLRVHQLPHVPVQFEQQDMPQQQQFQPGNQSPSSSSSNNNNPSGNQSIGSNNASMKMGRKGDPRMHRAVAARLSNPKISLFEALQVGGFEYPNDEDSNAVDSENITLGQRKNQLSRRVRLARQHQGSGRGSKKRSQIDDGGLDEDPAVHLYQEQKLKEENSPEQQGASQMAKNHPEYHPIVNHRISAISNSLGRTSAVMADPYGQSPQITWHGTCNVAATSADASQNQVGILPVAAGTSLHNRQNGVILNPNRDTTFPTQLAGIGLLLPPQQIQQAHSNLAATAIHNPTSQQQQNQHLMNVVTNDSSRRNSGASSPPLNMHFQQPSGVAVASLTNTAASVGLTLEQLAVALRSSPLLSQILLSARTPSKSRQDLAVALYQNENRALYAKAMLLAGYASEIAVDERSPEHLQVALAAWQNEGQRLQALMSSQAACSNSEVPLEANTGGGNGGGATGAGTATGGGRNNNNDKIYDMGGGDTDQQGNGASAGATGGNQAQYYHHSQHSGGVSSEHKNKQEETRQEQQEQQLHQHEHDHQQQQQQNSRCSCFLDNNENHIHRLEGKCGHKAILHQPGDGTAHIDFVVGDHVECYREVQPLSHKNSSDIKLWPSNYTCQDLSCPEQCRDGAISRKRKHIKHNHDSSECARVGRDGTPKILNLSEINMEDNDEWIPYFDNDETVLGLFKLGTSDSQSTAGKSDQMSSASVVMDPS